MRPLSLFFRICILACPAAIFGRDMQHEDSCTAPEASREAHTRPAGKDSAVILDRMLVTGKRFDNAKPSVRILEADDFKGKYADLPAVLEQESGIEVQRSGAAGEYAVASIRGEPGDNVKVFLDGMPLNSAAEGVVDLGKLSLYGLQRIEMYKGVAPLELSEQGIGNVINLCSKPLSNLVSSTASIGSYGYKKFGVLAAFPVAASRHLLSIDLLSSTNAYLFPDQTTPYAAEAPIVKVNNGYSHINGTYNGSVPISHAATLRSNVFYSWYDKGEFLPFVSDYQQKMETSGSNAGLVERLETNVTPSLFLALEGKARMQGDSQYVPADLHVGLPEHSDYRTLFGETKLSASLSPVAQLVLNAYALYGHEKYFPESPESESFFAVRNRVAAALSGTFTPASALRFKALGMDSYDIDTAAGVYRFRLFSESARSARANIPGIQCEAAWDPGNGLGLFIDGYESTHNPTFVEKFGTSASFFGNPQLKPETRYQAEAGLSGHREPVTSSLALFYGFTRDKIVSTMQSQGMLFPQNYSGVLHYGLEWNAGVALSKWLSATNNITWMKNTFHDVAEPALEGKSVALLPDFKECMALQVSWKNVTFSHSLVYCSPDYFDNDNTSVNVSSPVLNVSLKVKFLSHYALSYRIDNYLDAHNLDFQYDPKPGRTHFVELSADFGEVLTHPKEAQ